MQRNMNRRNWFACCTGALAGAGILGHSITLAGPGEKSVAADDRMYNFYFGDLHNHNNVGYAQGSLERSFDIASHHLDFYAFTPHSQWHDMPIMEQDKHMKWVDGFAETRKRWPEVMEINRRYHEDGKFVSYPAFEWHSSGFGDFCCIFPGDKTAAHQSLPSPDKLKAFAAERGAILIPHHPAYRRGRRGANPTVWDPKLMPLLEIYSEHGFAESDSGPYDYIRHSMGGRFRENTYREFLRAGHRLGAIASTDDHLGYPGSYGMGLAVVLAPELTRSSVMEALWKRRAYGVTGDRIELDFRLNGHLMGSEIPFDSKREIYVDVVGWDAIEVIEVLKNNRVIHREHPIDKKTADLFANPVLGRIEFGWGPWASLGMARVCDWQFDLELEGGKIVDIQPCFQSGPYEEEKRNRIENAGSGGFSVKSYTSRRQAFMEKPTNAVALKMTGNAESVLRIKVNEPSPQIVEKRLGELVSGNEVLFTGPFPDESLISHSLTAEPNYRHAFTFTDTVEKGSSTDWYYVRVVQRNGQLGWSSPVWVEARG